MVKNRAFFPRTIELRVSGVFCATQGPLEAHTDFLRKVQGNL
jgi:hypothetical protein